MTGDNLKRIEERIISCMKKYKEIDSIVEYFGFIRGLTKSIDLIFLVLWSWRTMKGNAQKSQSEVTIDILDKN